MTLQQIHPAPHPLIFFVGSTQLIVTLSTTNRRESQQSTSRPQDFNEVILQEQCTDMQSKT